MVNLMLRVFKPIIVTWNAVVLGSGFCAIKDITKLLPKGVYKGYIITNKRYWTKGFPVGIIDTNFKYKEVSDVGMIEAIIQENQLFRKLL